jgi:glycosyltransferase involved in cell wall biosynthesis
MIHEAIGNQSAIAKVAMAGVKTALDVGWRVTVVAKLLDPSLQGDVEWLKMYCPPRGFALQWLTARMFINRALGDRTFDVIHGHQPQIASLCDVFQCHFLTRVAYERKCLEERRTLRARAVRLQQQAVMYAEDFYYRNWNRQTTMLFDSALTQEDFHRLYGKPPREEVLLYECPPLDLASDAERRAARAKWVGVDERRFVIGYLGGLQERKGYRRIENAVRKDDSLFFLMGGQFCDGYVADGLSGRMKAVGLVRDTASFYAACDVLVVPSFYEPFGLVTYEAAVRGTPVIATPEVGAMQHLKEFGVGLEWQPDLPLSSLFREVNESRSSFPLRARRMAIELSRENSGKKLLGFYHQVLREKASRGAALTSRKLAGAA